MTKLTGAVVTFTVGGVTFTVGDETYVCINVSFITGCKKFPVNRHKGGGGTGRGAIENFTPVLCVCAPDNVTPRAESLRQTVFVSSRIKNIESKHCYQLQFIRRNEDNILNLGGFSSTSDDEGDRAMGLRLFPLLLRMYT